MSKDDLWVKVCKNFIKAGVFDTPLTDTLQELTKLLLTRDQAEFLLMFDKATLSIDQIKERTTLDEGALNRMLESVMASGVVMGLPSRRSGLMVYRLLPLFPGIFEIAFMRGGTTEKDKKLATLFEQIFKEMVPGTQNKYERTIKNYKRLPAFDRVIPVEEEIEGIDVEKILPVEEVKLLIEKHDIIGVSHCYCRHERDLLNDPCKRTDSRENCMYFGRFAQFLIDQDFADKISKERALKILKESEESALVHKTFHDRLNPEMDEIAVCSCCKCCCGIFDLYYKGVLPLHSITSYQSAINKDECVGCGTCVEKCPTEAIELIDEIADVNIDKCIGCGICAHFCPESAINMERTGQRQVFIPPPKLSTN